jgi:hypothetical protein
MSKSSVGQVGRVSKGAGKPRGLARPGGATQVKARKTSSGNVARPGGNQHIR